MSEWTEEELKDYIGLAESGDTDVQIYLGWAYASGTHVNKDEDLGRKWLQEAASRGSKEAAFRLAVFLTAKDDPESVAMLAKLSAEGFAPAAYELGNFYWVGFLVPRDTAAAEREWLLAATNGHQLAKLKLLKCESLRSPLWKKPLLFAKMIWLGVTTAPLLSKNKSDPRVLGTLK
ncbi:sel1 repeat family protein [Bradyrhizobium sp. 166]|uniref:tetratricopeptide repeat protein n=1 Tax=Bradyrhizobium sp. 166 TaxID=2782638 RepID=UPI001FF825B4|nr:tetratricopeptide repeat protein [Bradyrhizobium sp. 166]MCK1600485.1 sel1 repeat family protein [Bradyrhizobium sp. 166]